MAVTLEKDEMDQKPFDPFEVKNKKQGYVYRFLNVNSNNIANKMWKGYEIVKDTDQEKLVVNDATPIKKGADLDTTKRLKDVVLARIPQEKFDKIKTRHQQAVKRQSQMIVTDYDKETGPLGFNPRRDPTGHATRYSGGQTQTGYDKEKLPDKEFESKYGFSKKEVE